MAKLIVGKEVANVIALYRKAGGRIDACAKRAVYKGAGQMADAIKQELKALPTVSDKNGLPPYAPAGTKLKSISKVQKRDLIDSLGISGFDKGERGDVTVGGYISVKIGFDGYGSYPTKSYPEGIPNQLLMRSLEKGTSFLKKNSVVTKTVKRMRQTVEITIADEMMKLLKKEF